MAFVLLYATLVAPAVANPFDLSNFDRYDPIKTGIDWQPCPGSYTGNRQCGRFEVPMDYKDKNAGKASLAVAIYRSPKWPPIGTLFLNPGGPGGSGVGLILGSDADVIMKIAGNQYDLVSWDPRGVGYTVPRADCFLTALEEDTFWEGTIPRTGIEARGNLENPKDREAFYSQFPDVDRILEKLGKRCPQFVSNAYQYFGTVATVKDMVALHDYLEPSRRVINFWGFSYGTVIGQYFVNMFPGRVGQVVLDGVVNATYYTTQPPHMMWSHNIESSEEALNGFISTCAAAGPAKCAFSQGESERGLRDRINDLIILAYDYKEAGGDINLFGSADVRNTLYRGMFFPTSWPQVARNLQCFWDYMSPNPVTQECAAIIERIEQKKKSLHLQEPPVYAIQAITCSDAADPGGITTLHVFKELFRTAKEVSPMFGPMWVSPGFYCHQWPVRAVERYQGPWNNKLSNKILIIGNKADPTTPLKWAKYLAEELKDSAVLLKQDSWGHTSLSLHSKCTLQILEAYFAKNLLPPSGTVCGGDTVPIFKSTVQLFTNSSIPILDPPSSELVRTSPSALFAIAFACASALVIVMLVVRMIQRYRTEQKPVQPSKFKD